MFHQRVADKLEKECKSNLKKRNNKQHLDVAIVKIVSFAKEPERMKDVVEPAMLGVVAELEFQYGAEVFEAYQQMAKAETAAVSEVKTPEVKNKSR